MPPAESLLVPAHPVTEDISLDCPELGKFGGAILGEEPLSTMQPPLAQPETTAQIKEEEQEAALQPPSEVVVIIPPWDPTHPDHATSRSQEEAAALVMMPRTMYISNLQRAVEAREELPEKLARLAA